VAVSPSLALPDRQMAQPAGTDALLTCLVHAFPPTELHWVHHDRGDGRLPTIANEKYRVQNWTVDEYSILFGLHISSMAASDYGTYQCRARNDYGEDSAKIVVSAGKLSYHYHTHTVHVKRCLLLQVDQCFQPRMFGVAAPVCDTDTHAP